MNWREEVLKYRNMYEKHQLNDEQIKGFFKIGLINEEEMNYILGKEPNSLEASDTDGEVL